MASFFQPKAYGPELLALAKQIGVNPRDGRLMLLVEDMAKPESLPARWTSKFDLKKKRWVYTYLPTNEVCYLHPSIDYYRGALFMDMGGYRVLLRNLEARPPTDEEIARMNEYFAIGQDEDPYIREVGQLACVAPLPEGFEEIPDETGTGAMYKDKETNIMLDEHPLDAYFRELRDRRRRELARRRLATIKAMQALRMLHRSGSKDTYRDESEGKDEEEKEELEKQMEDPRLTALMLEWQLLQVRDGESM
ncbi:hypothetical protein VaNZ11_002211 [Volvox africanus]|uniref:Flagellar associated protein n=1 Tax=Volvox africanus TaxID=51714 RepID=A0ABQ5RSB2_9CHLO|nr:hypothetical protein VaNZ11_002211 [Volvox africanus]